MHMDHVFERIALITGWFSMFISLLWTYLITGWLIYLLLMHDLFTVV